MWSTKYSKKEWDLTERVTNSIHGTEKNQYKVDYGKYTLHLLIWEAAERSSALQAYDKLISTAVHTIVHKIILTQTKFNPKGYISVAFMFSLYYLLTILKHSSCPIW